MPLHRTAGRRLATGVLALGLVSGALAATSPLAAADPVPAGYPVPADLNTSGSFSDSFTLPSASAAGPMYGLNVGLGPRQQGGTAHDIGYTRVSGRWDGTPAPEPGHVRVGQASAPNKLSFMTGLSAIMLDAPVIADGSGHYTVSTVVDPMTGDTASGNWASVSLARSHRSSGYVTANDVDLGLTVSSNGDLQLFHRGMSVGEVPFWSGHVAPGPGGAFDVTVDVSTGADRLVRLTVNGTPFSAAAPADVTRWPSSAYLYLGAYNPTDASPTTFGDGAGRGLTVSRVDTTATSGPHPFVDTFDGVPGGAADNGLNGELSARQPTLVSANYSPVSGAPGLPVSPPAGAVRVNGADQPNRLALSGGSAASGGNAAVRLNKPATADLDSGTYTVRAALTPVVGSSSSADWASLVLSGSSASSGWVEGADVALGLRVRADGRLQLFQGGTALWAAERSVPAAETYQVSVAVRPGPARTATVTVNGTAFPVDSPADLPRDGYLLLGTHQSAAGQVSAVDDLRVSMLGGLDYYGYFDTWDPDNNPNSVNHLPEVQPWTNFTQFIRQDPASGFLDYCLPQACVLDAGNLVWDNSVWGQGSPLPDTPARLAAFRQKIDGNLGKIGLIYMVDEPSGYRMDLAAQNTAIGQIEQVFPGKGIGLTLVASELNRAEKVPAGVELVGYDEYCVGRARTAANVVKLKAKLASPDQHLFLIPETNPAGVGQPVADGCGSSTDATIAAGNLNYRAIAAADPRITYLMNFRWIGQAQYTGSPKTVAAQQAIGRAVVDATDTARPSGPAGYDPATGAFTAYGRGGEPLGTANLGAGGLGMTSGDVLLSGHWTGPGTDTLGYYRPSTRQFFLSDDNATVARVITYGNTGDVPLVGDWDGTGRTTIGVYRPGDQHFYLSNDNATPAYSPKFGNPGDVPLVGNWSGTGRSTVAVYRPSTQEFFMSFSNTAPVPNRGAKYGNPGDLPVKGDWDASGTDGIGVYRPSDQTLYAGDDDAVNVFSRKLGTASGVQPLTGNWG
ncbi:hypothetical protein [Kitasatospora sp. NPDC004272]